MSRQGVLILGAGPAGAAVALGLQRLGYTVQVVSDWRRFAAVEGVSQRVLDGLRQAGLLRALAAPGGSVIEVLLDVDVITTRGTLAAIRARAQSVEPPR